MPLRPPKEPGFSDGVALFSTSHPKAPFWSRVWSWFFPPRLHASALEMVTLDTYVCSVCKQTYSKVWTDEEALAETATVWGSEYQAADCDIVCDDCWRKMMGLPPEGGYLAEDVRRRLNDGDGA